LSMCRTRWNYLAALAGEDEPRRVVYLQLPNFQKLLRRGPREHYMGPPEHLQFFTLETMRRTLDKAGVAAGADTLAAAPARGATNPVRWLGKLLWNARGS